MDYLETLDSYVTLLNTILTAIVIIVSIISIIFTNKNAKKSIEETKKESRNQQYRYEEEKKRHEKTERLREQPYLVFKGAKISSQSDEKIKRIDMFFINKGRGPAYDIVPISQCTANTIHNKVELYRCDAIQDPIARIGEKFKTMWTLGHNIELVDFSATISINYSDASGRKYIQKFNIIFFKNGAASITNYAQPELCEE